MGFLDRVKDTVEDAQDTVEKVVDEAQETARDVQEGVENAVDQVQDAVQGGKNKADSVKKKAENVKDKAENVQEKAGNVKQKAEKVSKDRGGQSSSGSGSKGISDPQRLRDVLRGDAKFDTKDDVTQKDMQDSDIVNEGFKKAKPGAPVFETPSEQEASRTQGDLNNENASYRDFRSAQASTAFEKAAENKKQIQKTRQQTQRFLENQLSASSVKQDVIQDYQKRIEKVGSRENFSQEDARLQSALERRVDKLRSMDIQQFKQSKEFQNTKVSLQLGDKTRNLSVSDARDLLQEKKDELSQKIDRIESNQEQRLDQLASIQNLRAQDNSNITGEEAATMAKNNDFSKQDFKPTFLGRKFNTKLTGPAAEAALVFDAVTSGGEKSADVFGAAVDQYVGSDKGDKTVEQVAEENLVLNTQRLREGGFDPVKQAGKTLGSVPGIFATSAAGGAAFSGVVKGAGALPKVGGAAQKAVQAAGIGAGAYTLAKQGGRIKGELEAGQETEAIGTLVETGTGFVGFMKGQRKFNSYLGARTGTTRVQQKNFLRSTGENTAEGFGRFTSRTVIEKPTVRDYLNAVRGRGFNPKTEVVRGSGRFGISSSRSGSQAQGKINIEYPTGKTRTKTFESVFRKTGEGTTRTGKKFRVTEDTVRFREEGKFFRNFRDSTSVTKNIRTSRSKSSADEVVSQFSDLAVRTDSNIIKTRIQGVSSDSSAFTDTTNYFVARAGRGRGGSSGSGSGQVTGGSGGSSTSFRVQEILQSDVQSFVRSQNPSPTVSSGSAFSVSGSGAEGNQAGISDLADFDTGQVQQSEQSQQTEVNVRTGTRTVDRLQRRNQGTSGGSVSSTAKELNQEFKDSASIKDVGTEEISDRFGRVGGRGTRQVQRKTREFEEFSGVGSVSSVRAFQGRSVSQSFRLGVSSVLDSEVVQSYRSQLGTVQVPGRSAAGAGGFPVGFDQEVQSGQAQGTGMDVAASVSDSLNLDWISANRVEQSGGEARFDVSEKPENPLFGLKAVQEQRKEVNDAKILDDSMNGDDNIW